uniref:NADH dehydrogenase-like complex L n=1 Tax=Monsonia marlothii TaxID=163685 RepID=A0A0F7H040_9ROSI
MSLSSSSLCSHIPKALPPLIIPCSQQHKSLLPINAHLNHAKYKHRHHKTPPKKQNKSSSLKLNTSNLGIQLAAILATVGEQPALALTGVNNNNEEDFGWVLIQLGIVAFIYFLVAPPLIMNWMRTRWYKRNLVEMYFQFMFTFIFFPGLLIWAPFLNFRKLPRDPSMRYPWDVPKDPSKIETGYLKYPWATEEDYKVD